MLKDAWVAIGKVIFRDRSFQGTWSDRVANLFDLDVVFEGSSVLDVGCNMGIVGLEVCKHLPKKYHGIERMAAHHFIAQSVFQGAEIPNRVDRININSKKERDNILDSTYDVVLYLAVHQHLKKQAGQEVATATLEDLLARCSKYFVFRGPDIEEVVDFAKAQGFVVGKQFPRGKLNPICALVRN